MEQQTIKDTTKGEPRPLGQRRAVKADSIPGDEGTVPDEPQSHPADQDRRSS
jgi:hypothetical protein